MRTHFSERSLRRPSRSGDKSALSAQICEWQCMQVSVAGIPAKAGVQYSGLSVQRVLALPRPRRNNLLRYWAARGGYELPPFDALQRLEKEMLRARPDAAVGRAIPVRPIVTRLVIGAPVVGHFVVNQACLGQTLVRQEKFCFETFLRSFVYVVRRHVIVRSNDLRVLRPGHRDVLALQACHPRFFATHRYLAYAKPVRITPAGGAPFVPRP